MAKTPRSVEQARRNLEAVAPLIGTRYREGIQGADWQAAAASDAAEANFAARMQAAIQRKARQAGVRRVSNEEWRQAAEMKGAPIIGERITQALDKWQARFGAVYGPVVRAVQGLPPKGVDPLANVDRRLKPVVQAWVQNKLRGKA
jgi:hypothetical protein